MIDLNPTILEAVGVESPSMLNGVPQARIEGVSMAYTFAVRCVFPKALLRCAPPALLLLWRRAMD